MTVIERDRLGTALLVEDDPSVLTMLRRHLNRAGVLVHEAHTEDEGLRRARERASDVAIIDLRLAEGSGESLCSRLRADAGTRDLPIVVLTGRADIDTKVDLFRRGVDEYLVKPCAPEEIVARVEAILRRSERGPKLQRIGALSVALRSGDAWLGEVRLDLTAGERVVLAELARTWPALARREALERARGRDDRNRTVSTNVLEVLVARLRVKLRDAGGQVAIRTVRGAGYLLETTGSQGEGQS